MDYLAGYQERRSGLREFSEPVLLVQGREPSVRVAYLLMFNDVAGLVRIDVASEGWEPIQLVCDVGRLVPRLLDPM